MESDDSRIKADTSQTFVIDKTRIEQSEQKDLADSGVGHMVESYNQDLFETRVLEQINDIYKRSTHADDLVVSSTSSNNLAHNGEIRDAKALQLKTIVYDCGVSKSAESSSKVNTVFSKADSSDRKVSNKYQKSGSSESDYIPSEEEEEDEESNDEEPSSSRDVKLRRKRKCEKVSRYQQFSDDGCDNLYRERLKKLRKTELHRTLERVERHANVQCEEESVELRGGLTIDAKIWDRLYKYQKTGVRWLWELHRQSVGGILGDEMGLGKTIQIIAFLGALKRSNLSNEGFEHPGLGPCLIICPPTLMRQWVKEFHLWCPIIRIAILHDTGSHKGCRQSLIRKIISSRGILLASYVSLTLKSFPLQKYDWHYIILDEGHKIRNPESRTTLAVKQFRTPHRLILTGTPMQNSLRELWSIFDFVFPGRLGSLVDFLREFGIPITQGGYANASETQVRTAYKCACALREIISPYLLRRTKSQVKNAINLPSKSEQVLFCRLTDHQRHIYRQYLQSRECQSIFKGSYEIFVGLINLRKLCNHPDLITGGPNRLGNLSETVDETVSFGHWQRSGKMIVVKSLLKLWKEQNHKVLLFSQSRRMLNILEILLKSEGHSYLRMDGSTTMASRQNIVDRYNNDDEIFCFLLTTRVGGLGINLTAADRVLIYDPDWNPSTDSQAKERAWRIGQTKPVTVYRLLTSGTIEEKIYHRQIFKQFLTNRILKDPKQRRFFKTNDLYELFTLTDKESHENSTETSSIFSGIGSEVNFFDHLSETNKKEKIIDESDDEVDESRKNDCTKPCSSTNLSYLWILAKKLSQELSACGGDDFNPKLNTDAISKKFSSKKLLRGAKFENDVRIPHLVKQQPYKTPQGCVDDEKKSRCDDNYVLTKLFKKSNVHSAMTHDKIVEADNPDYALIEVEAETVARNAVKALNESRRRWIDANHSLSGRVQIQKSNLKPRFGPKKPAVVDVVQRKVAKKTRVKSDEVSSLFSGFDLVRSTKLDESSSSSALLTKIKMRNAALYHSGSSDDDGEADESNLASYRTDPGVQLPPPVTAPTSVDFSSLENRSSIQESSPNDVMQSIMLQERIFVSTTDSKLLSPETSHRQEEEVHTILVQEWVRYVKGMKEKPIMIRLHMTVI